jgi:hypothetical protein
VSTKRDAPGQGGGGRSSVIVEDRHLNLELPATSGNPLDLTDWQPFAAVLKRVVSLLTRAEPAP